MKDPKTYKAEAFDIMQYFYRAAHDPLVRCLVRLDGHIDADALKHAVALSARTVPLVLCRFNDKARRPRWEAGECTADDAVRIRVADGEGFEERLLAQMTVDAFRGPQLVIAVARRPGADALCIVMNHMVCDGGGFKDYLYLLCDLYSKCRYDLNYTEDLPPSPRSIGQLIARFSWRERLRIFKVKDELGKQRNDLRVRLEGKDGSPFIVPLAIPAERFAAARARAKALGATANDVLLAAYARALCRETGESPIILPCPIDLRKYLPDGTPRITNLTGNLFCEVEIEAGEGLETTLRKVARAMEVQKNSAACLKGPLLYGILYPLVPYRVLRANFSKLFTIPATSFTNLGVLDDMRLRFDGVHIADAYLTAAIKRVPYFQVTASTFRGRCTLTCNLNGTAGDRMKIEQLLMGMGNEIMGEEQ